MQWFLTKYLDGESKRASLVIRFVALLPKQLVTDTDLGRPAASEYARREGITLEKFMERFSVPLIVFGPKRAVIYVGQMYLVFNGSEHVQLFTQHFDDLVRAAVIQPTELGAFLGRLDS